MKNEIISNVYHLNFSDPVLKSFYNLCDKARGSVFSSSNQNVDIFEEMSEILRKVAVINFFI